MDPTTVVPFHAKAASREAWARFHAFRRIRHAERDPDDPILDDASLEALFRRDDPMDESQRFAAMSFAGDVVGWLEFEVFRPGTPSHAQNPHLAWFNLEVPRAHRRHGVGRTLLGTAADLAHQHGKTLLATYADEPDGIAFLKRIDGQFAQARRENRLSFERVDWGMVRRWAQEGPARSPGTRFRWFRDRIDDDVLDAYCQVFTEVFNQQPFDQVDLHGMVFTPDVFREREAALREAGGTWLTVIGVESDGAISGLTEMTYFPSRMTMIGQGLTGVRDVYRGRGLGKWLKAAMLLRVREEFPEVRVVVTGNASSNAAMLSINERLGFRTHREGWMIQVPLESVERYVRERGAKAPQGGEG